MGPRRRRRGRRKTGRGGLVRSTRFNGATSSPTWKGRAVRLPARPRRGASMGPRRRRRGRELGLRRDSPQPVHASMGPRRRRRGRSSQRRSCAGRSQGFNGATSSPTWKDGERLARCWQDDVSFNGATSSPTWKGQSGLAGNDARTVASMGPRRRRRGRSGLGLNG